MTTTDYEKLMSAYTKGYLLARTGNGNADENTLALHEIDGDWFNSEMARDLMDIYP